MWFSHNNMLLHFKIRLTDTIGHVGVFYVPAPRSPVESELVKESAQCLINSF